MAWFREHNKSEKSAVSADFRRALTEQVLRTELIRIKALIGTTVVLASLILIIYVFDPYAIQHLWHGKLNPSDLFVVLVPFVLFETWVFFVVRSHLGKDHDLPVFRRYISALVETSMPTFALAMHIDSMGPVEALGFAVPLTYFIFVILSTLRLDFWLSTFTGFVAAVELFCMAMFYHRAGSADPPPDLCARDVRPREKYQNRRDRREDEIRQSPGAVVLDPDDGALDHRHLAIAAAVTIAGVIAEAMSRSRAQNSPREALIGTKIRSPGSAFACMTFPCPSREISVPLARTTKIFDLSAIFWKPPAWRR